MNIDDCYPSKYLKASDIGENKEVTVVIDRVEIVQMKGDDGQHEVKPVVFFRGKEKGMTLNIVNKNTIKKLYGAMTENWVGQAIRIGTSWVDAFGDQTLALRVRPIVPQVAQGRLSEPRTNGHTNGRANGHTATVVAQPPRRGYDPATLPPSRTAVAPPVSDEWADQRPDDWDLDAPTDTNDVPF